MRGGVRKQETELLQGGREIEAIVLCPQCLATRVWDNLMNELKALIGYKATEAEIKVAPLESSSVKTVTTKAPVSHSVDKQKYE